MFDWTWKHTLALIIALVILGGFVISADAQDTGICVFQVTEPFTFIEFVWVRGQETETTEVWFYEGNETARFRYPLDADWITIVVNANQTECTNTVLPSEDAGYDDGRVNEQAGDSFFAVYVVNGYVDVYATGSGQGVRILHTQLPACSADGTACFDGSTVTLIDPEGKVYYVQVTL